MKRLALLFLLAVPVGAQTLPFKPEPIVRVKLTCIKTDVACRSEYGTKPWYQPFRVEHRTADRKWDALTMASAALTVGDVENSLYALRQSRAREANPIFGQHPTRLRYYGIILPVFGAEAYLSWQWKRGDDALRDAGIKPHHGFSSWWVPEMLNIGAHTVGILVTLGSTKR
jgi:hypothetical protein